LRILNTCPGPTPLKISYVHHDEQCPGIDPPALQQPVQRQSSKQRSNRTTQHEPTHLHIQINSSPAMSTAKVAVITLAVGTACQQLPTRQHKHQKHCKAGKCLCRQLYQHTLPAFRPAGHSSPIHPNSTRASSTSLLQAVQPSCTACYLCCCLQLPNTTNTLPIAGYELSPPNREAHVILCHPA
jgi:hypothetical protein